MYDCVDATAYIFDIFLGNIAKKATMIFVWICDVIYINFKVGNTFFIFDDWSFHSFRFLYSFLEIQCPS